MSRQSKNRKHRISAASSKGHMAGKHYAEGQQKMKCPHQQPAPAWLKAAGTKKSWWNKKVTRREKPQQDASARH